MTRAGVPAFMVRAYLRRKSGVSFTSSATFDAQERFNPAEAIFTLPPDEPPLQVGDLVAGFAISESLPAQGWLKYLGYRALTPLDFEGAESYALLTRQTFTSQAGGVFAEWVETGETVRALSREVDDEPAEQGGVVKRHRVLELTLEGARELDPMSHRLARGGFEYVVLDGRSFPSYALAKVKEVERGYVDVPTV